jgi:hypothetical protein
MRAPEGFRPKSHRDFTLPPPLDRGAALVSAIAVYVGISRTIEQSAPVKCHALGQGVL